MTSFFYWLYAVAFYLIMAFAITFLVVLAFDFFIDFWRNKNER